MRTRRLCRPTEVQTWILYRMTVFSWRIEATPVQIALYDTRDTLRRPIVQLTFQQLVEGGWIEEEAGRPGSWRETQRARDAAGVTEARNVRREMEAFTASVIRGRA